MIGFLLFRFNFQRRCSHVVRATGSDASVYLHYASHQTQGLRCSCNGHDLNVSLEIHIFFLSLSRNTIRHHNEIVGILPTDCFTNFDKLSIFQMNIYLVHL